MRRIHNGHNGTRERKRRDVGVAWGVEGWSVLSAHGYGQTSGSGGEWNRAVMEVAFAVGSKVRWGKDD